MSEQRGIDRMFEQMTNTYGRQRMVSTFGEDWEQFKIEYVRQIQRCKFSTERLKTAVENLADYHPSFPPLPGEFVAMCRKIGESSLSRQVPVIKNEPKPDPALAQKYLEQIKIVSKAKNSDWATALLNRSLNEAQINHTSQRMALDALSAHGRLAEAPAAWVERNKATWNNYTEMAA